MDEDYLMIPVCVWIKDIAPIYFPLITEIFQRGLDEETSFPAIFDYNELDKETKETTLRVSFAITKSSKGLTVKQVKGKERGRILAQMQDLEEAPVKKKKKKTQSSGKKQK